MQEGFQKSGCPTDWAQMFFGIDCATISESARGLVYLTVIVVMLLECIP